MTIINTQEIIKMKGGAQIIDIKSILVNILNHNEYIDTTKFLNNNINIRGILNLLLCKGQGAGGYGWT